MTPYGILAIVSLALLGLAYIALVIAALRVCAWSATGIMFLNPFSVIPFIITHWGKAKYAVYLALGAAAFMLAAIGVQQIIQTDQVLGGEEVGFELTMPKGWNERQKPNPDEPEPLKIKEWNLSILKPMEPRKDTERHGKTRKDTEKEFWSLREKNNKP